ncbi:MAG: fibronectin type III domain-containing protein, partial [Clostridia bacterium]
TRYCLDCEAYETQEISKTSHIYTATITPPTCTENGYTTYKCEECGDTYTDNEIDPTGHTFGNWITTTTATCTSTGTQTRYCTACEAYETQEIAKTTHTYKATITPPTCTQSGYTTYKCEQCGDTYILDETSAIGHDYGQWVTTKSATTTQTGEEQRVCSLCGDVQTQIIEIISDFTSLEVKITSCVASDNSIEVSWEEIQEAQGYYVYLCSEKGWEIVGKIDATAELSMVIEDLIPNFEYGVKVIAYKIDFNGIFYLTSVDEIVTVQTDAIKTEMTTFTNTFNAIHVNWEEISIADGYRVYQLIDGAWVKLATLYGSDTTTYRVENLTYNTDYIFSVRAFIRDENGTAVFQEYSDEFEAYTDPTQVEMTTFTNTFNAIRVNWEEISIADGYRVYQLIDGAWVKLVTLYGSDTTTYRVENLIYNTDYIFSVRAFIRDENGTAVFQEYSDEFTAYTDPTQVEMTTFTNTFDAIRVNWEEISIADGYRVYQLIDGEWVKLVTLYGSDTTTYRISGLSAGTVYTYAVKAFIRDDSGTAIFQEVSESLVTMTDLASATITSASKTSDAIRINWNEVNGATGYKIYMLVDGKWITYDTLYEGDITTYRLSGLSCDTTYQFKVCAFSKEIGTTVWGTSSDIKYVTTN